MTTEVTITVPGKMAELEQTIDRFKRELLTFSDKFKDKQSLVIEAKLFLSSLEEE